MSPISTFSATQVAAGSQLNASNLAAYYSDAYSAIAVGAGGQSSTQLPQGISSTGASDNSVTGATISAASNPYNY
jgi:hypothetical protein